MAVDDIKFSNNSSTTTTDSPLLLAATTINITDGTVIPEVVAPAYAYATIQDSAGDYEIVKITAHTASATSMTVERGKDNTSAAEWPNGTLIEMRPNVAIFEALRDHDHNSEYADLANTIDGGYHYATLTSSGTDAYTANLVTAPAALVAGLRVSFIPDVANTGACSLDLNGFGAAAIKMQDNNDPYSNYMGVNSLVELEYDGTEWVLMSPPLAPVSADSTQTLTNKTLTSPVINSQNGYGEFFYDGGGSNLLVSGSGAYGSWQTYSGSVLSAVNAKIALINWEIVFTANANPTRLICGFLLRKDGSSGSAGSLKDKQENSDSNGPSIMYLRMAGEAWVLLDASGHFQWYTDASLSGGGGSISSVATTLYVTAYKT